MLNHFCSMPDCATVFTTTEKIKFSPVSEMNRGNGVALQFTNNNGLNIRLTADGAASRFLGIRWRMTMAENSLFLADAWERTYGDTGWRNFDASRLMPWYFLQKTTDSVRCFGVKVRPAAFAAWTADPHGVTLWLDLRSGTRGVELNGRTLDVATVLFCESADDAWSVAGEFCRAMCADPLLTPSPVYGGNNWYYGIRAFLTPGNSGGLSLSGPVDGGAAEPSVHGDRRRLGSLVRQVRALGFRKGEIPRYAESCR